MALDIARHSAPVGWPDAQIVCAASYSAREYRSRLKEISRPSCYSGIGTPSLNAGQVEPVTVLDKFVQCLGQRRPRERDGQFPPTYPEVNRLNRVGGLLHEYGRAA